LIDNFKVYRVNASGPQWSVRDIDQFNDTFEELVNFVRKGTGEMTSAGKARADMANDLTPAANYNSIVPGDSSVVKVADPVAGLATDPGNGRAAVYIYARVIPVQGGKAGAALSGDLARWPYIGNWVDAGGNTWTCIQLDSSIVNGFAQPDIYCVDLNDNLFDAGDEIQFFYAAKSAAAVETYCFGSALGAQGSDKQFASVNASEFSILPIRGNLTGTRDILYVDGMDGRGGQPYFDSAFQSLGILGDIDRYDVRGPSSSVSNRPAGRVKDVSQLLAAYRKIVWDTGDLEQGLGNGSSTPEKTNDYKLVNSFLNNLATQGGVYLAGDDLASALNTYQSSLNPNGIDAITFKSTYLPYNLIASNARPSFGISPIGTAVAAGCFVSDTSMFIYGGCPLINDFDVMQPQGTTKNEMTYGAGTATSSNGAVISRTFNNGSVNVGILFGGFSFIYIRDNDANGRKYR
jgi:hypothetical protein